MNEVLRSILSNGCVTSEDGKIRTLESAISQEEGDFIQEMIRSARARDRGLALRLDAPTGSPASTSVKRCERLVLADTS